MKLVLITAIIFLTSCVSETKYGKCIGMFDEKNPTLEYKLSAWNAFIGIVFFELIAPPIFVLVDQTHCPVGEK